MNFLLPKCLLHSSNSCFFFWCMLCVGIAPLNVLPSCCVFTRNVRNFLFSINPLYWLSILYFFFLCSIGNNLIMWIWYAMCFTHKKRKQNRAISLHSINDLVSKRYNLCRTTFQFVNSVCALQLTQFTYTECIIQHASPSSPLPPCVHYFILINIVRVPNIELVDNSL